VKTDEALLWVGGVAILAGALFCIPQRTRKFGIVLVVAGAAFLAFLVALVLYIANKVGS
jgi:hypothetical protein